MCNKQKTIKAIGSIPIRIYINNKNEEEIKIFNKLKKSKKTIKVKIFNEQINQKSPLI